MLGLSNLLPKAKMVHVEEIVVLDRPWADPVTKN